MVKKLSRLRNWFEVSKKGLGELLGNKCKSFVLFELIQNAWDENVSEVFISVNPVPGKSLVEVIVKDDSPDGFADLRDAFTLFAPSKKKADPEKRGRFNLGEKMVLSLCDEAAIKSTKGSVHFGSNGHRSQSSSSRKAGSEFRGMVRMTRTELELALKKFKTIIPPEGVKTMLEVENASFNLTRPKPVCTFEASLPTEVVNDEGVMCRTIRKTKVEVFEPIGEAGIYELGIPVLDTGDKFTYNIGQKVPLTMSRDNVPPAYLQDVRALALNETAHLLTEDESTDPWVAQATSDGKISKSAMLEVMDKQFGKDRVIYDPTDTEASHKAMSEGCTVIHGGSLNKDQWENVRRHSAAKPAGSVFPTRFQEFSPDGVPPIPRDKWTDGMKNVHAYATKLGFELMGIHLRVHFYDNLSSSGRACYGDRVLCFSKRSCGNDFFNSFPANRKDVTDLLLHEFGHEYASDHLSSGYHKALTKLGAKAVELALKNPGLFNG